METQAGIKKILVICLDNLGDAVMATSVMKPLKSLFPHAETGFWVKSYAADLFSDQSMIDHVHASDPFWDQSPGVGKGSFWKFRAALKEIKLKGYDVALVLNTEWRRSLAVMMARIPVRVGYDRRKSASFLTKAEPVAQGPQHFVDDHRHLLEMWSGKELRADDCLPRLDLTAQEMSIWRAWSEKNGVAARKYIVVHLFSGDEEKNWPLSCWVELIETMMKSRPQLRFVVAWGPGEEQKVAPYRDQLAKSHVIELAAASLSVLKAVLAHAWAVFGGDSGVGHVAAALGTPVLSLFGIGSPVRSRPLGRASVRVIEKSPLRQLYVPDMLVEAEELLSRL